MYLFEKDRYKINVHFKLMCTSASPVFKPRLRLGQKKDALFGLDTQRTILLSHILFFFSSSLQMMFNFDTLVTKTYRCKIDFPIICACSFECFEKGRPV
jgi:hypothetical protein